MTTTADDDGVVEVERVVADIMTSTPPPRDADAAGIAAARRTLAELGLWTLGVPESVGGGGASLRQTAAALFTIAQASPALAWAAVQAHAAAPLLTGRTDVLEQVHAGTIGIAVAVVTDLPTVVRVDACDEQPWVVLIAGGAARLVGPADARFEPTSRTGFDGALTRRTRLGEDVGEPLSGSVESALDNLYRGGVAVATGLAQKALDDAIDYCATRYQFGGPLTRIPAVRDALSDVRQDVLTLWSSAFSPAGVSAAAALRFDAACEAALDATATSLQLHGGYGYLTDYPAERRLRDAISLRAAGDTVGARRTSALDVPGAAA